MEKSAHAQLLNLPFLLTSILTITTQPPSFARQPQHVDHRITFSVNDVPENAQDVGQHSFSTPITLFNLKGAVNPRRPFEGLLPYVTSTQALESANVTVIEEELTSTMGKGKVEGIYVTGSDDGSDCMVAMTVIFGRGKHADSLRFFGELRSGLSESHIAVVGGTGRYHGANGFAVVKAIGHEVGGKRRKKKLLFNVYIK